MYKLQNMNGVHTVELYGTVNFFLSLHLQGKTDLFTEFQTYTLYILCSFEIKNF